ncbi:leucine/isoleucine/valine transporter permease subunit [Pigmentiphaga humi]|uniref:Leucine/isoleucine/valine transporter permease subunit n=1 Tax=Pigmentiphaga humi TaxID=2478468 RepID=A0A3P4B7H5_9BURK|nr:branched-chain amino acid ABC transporter permease [Pigmentiphaga humi]VCU72002.1 leucine/isoleucine/valine transporter permease subunit [Pigmentiphaga humi]
MRPWARVSSGVAWSLALGLLAMLAPLLLGSRFQLGLMSQMAAMAVLALSYNLLLGQTGLLSFGHAVYAGLGGFAVIHLLRATAQGGWALPVAALPLAGGLAGAAFALLIGYPTTRRGGTPFAMISLAIGELVYAAAGTWPELFGGESGLAGDRTAGPALGMEGWFDPDLGADLAMYYLTAGWALLCGAAIYGLGRMPLLRLANAVRENPQRVGFMGYDPHAVRFLMLVLAAFFAGLAGGLVALNLEIASVESLGTARSAMVLLAVVVGGSGFFLGPVLGALVVTACSVALSRYTGAWQLYLGLLFALVVLAMPGGLAGAACSLAGQWRRQGAWPWLRAHAWQAAAAVLLLAGLTLAVELAYGLAHGQAGNPAAGWFGLEFDARAPLPWAAACILLGMGMACRRTGKRHMALQEHGDVRQ